MYFANTDMLKKELEDLFENEIGSKAEEKPLNNSRFNNDVEQANIDYLILDFSAVNYVDSDGIRMLKQLIEDLKAKNVFVYICQFQGKLRFR